MLSDTHTNTHIIGRIPLEKESARRRDLYLYNTQHLQQTNIYTPGGIRTHYFKQCRPEMTNQWHECLKWHTEFNAVPVFFLISFARSVSLCCEEHVYIYTYV